MNKSMVAIVKGGCEPDENQIDTLVRRAVALTGGLESLVAPGTLVIIKPNLIAPAAPEQGATTDYRICKSLANQVRELGATAIIAEGSATGIDTEESIKASRYDVLRSEGYEVVDLKKSRYIRIPVPRGTALSEISVSELVLKADAIINVPKMKTHGQVLATLCIKNMKGILPDALKKRFHTTYGVFRSIAEVATVVKPTLNVLDGIIAQEGLGPLLGTPVPMGLVLAGRDPVAVDTVAALIMGIDPYAIETSKHAAELGVGTIDPAEIDTVGSRIEDVARRFKLSSEAMYEFLHMPLEFDLVFNEKACTGCRNGVLATLRDIEIAGRIDVLNGLRIVCGKMETDLPETDKKTLLVGACTVGHKSDFNYLEGCPPNCVDVLAAINALTDGDVR